MEAMLYKITLWTFFAGMIAHFISLVPREGSRNTGRLMTLGYILVISGFASLTWTIVSRWISQGRVPISSSYEYLSVLVWCVTVIYFIVMYKLRNAFIGVCLSPGLFLGMVFAGLYPKRLEMTLVPALQSYWLKIHVTMTIVGEAAFALAFVAGILYLIKNVEWSDVSREIRRRALFLFAVSLAAGVAVAAAMRAGGLMLTEVQGPVAFMGILGVGFLVSLIGFFFGWRKWMPGETGGFGGMVFSLMVVSLLVSGMGLGSVESRNTEQLLSYRASIDAVGELAAMLPDQDGELTRERWESFIADKREKLELLLALEKLQAEQKHALSREDAAGLLRDSRFAGELTFPLSLGEIREERRNLAREINELEGVIAQTGIPVKGSTLSAYRSRLINSYNSVFASDLLPHQQGRNAAFVGYMFLFAVPVFLVIYFVGRLIQGRIPQLETLDSLAYRSVSLGFPIFTVGALIAGAIWAHYAWGKWWSNDPKEMGSLIVWFTYLIYLHSRYVRRWSGDKAAVAAIIGFLFAVLSFVGNSVLGGLHSYG